MRKPLVWAGLLTLILAAAAAGFYLQKHTAQPARRVTDNGNQNQLMQPVLTGQTRPGFALPDLKGKLRDVSEWDGRVIAINFWATWCPPCLKEIPEFVALQNKYAGQGLQFVGVALQSADNVAAFVRKQGINYPVLVGGTDVINLAESLGDATGTLPYTVIIDRHKKIRFVKNGLLGGKQAEQIIKSLL